MNFFHMALPFLLLYFPRTGYVPGNTTDALDKSKYLYKNCNKIIILILRTKVNGLE